MGKIPDALRETIAHNIRACRMKKFPGRGGGKLCAEAFGVSPQQWSPWERGRRTPDEIRLAEIAAFFGVTVEDLRREPLPPKPPSAASGPHNAPRSAEDRPSPPFPDPPAATAPGMPPLERAGSPASFYWLLRTAVHHLRTEGISVHIHHHHHYRDRRGGNA